MLKTILAVMALTVFVVAPASSEIYKWTDENGNVHFSDQKPEESSSDTEAEVETVEDLQINVTDAYEPYQLDDSYIVMRQVRRSERRGARSSQPTDNSCAAKQARYSSSEACYSRCQRRTVMQPDGSVRREIVGACSCTSVQKPSC